MGNQALSPRTHDIENPLPPPPPLPLPTAEPITVAHSSSSNTTDHPVTFRVSTLPNATNLPSPRLILNTSSGILKTFMCRICLCYEELGHAFTVPNCDHQFCVQCLAGYLTSQIVDGQVILQCPYMNEENRRCETILTTEDISAVVLDPNVLSKLERFRAARENPDVRICPSCNAMQTGNAENPRMVCDTCGRYFCFNHSDAHPPEELCEDFEQRSKEQDAVSQAFVNKTSKPCPKCQSLTYKYTGCNHMKCSRCGQDWCWLCGESIVITGAYPRHYDRRNPTSSCAGKQFTSDGNEEEQPNHCGRFFRMLFYFSPLAIPFYLFAALLYLVITIITLPCLVASQTYRSCWLRRCIIIRIVTLCWAVVCFVVIFIAVLSGFIVSWLVGVAMGALCLPFCAIANRSELGRHLWCCCCWPAILVMGVINEDADF